MNKTNVINNSLELAFKKAVQEKTVNKKESIKISINKLKTREILQSPKMGSIPIEKNKRAVKTVSNKNES